MVLDFRAVCSSMGKTMGHRGDGVSRQSARRGRPLSRECSSWYTLLRDRRQRRTEISISRWGWASAMGLSIRRKGRVIIEWTVDGRISSPHLVHGGVHCGVVEACSLGPAWDAGSWVVGVESHTARTTSPKDASRHGAHPRRRARAVGEPASWTSEPTRRHGRVRLSVDAEIRRPASERARPGRLPLAIGNRAAYHT
jgi:hypothetical protein